VANPEWGTKRICQSCGAKFYDLHRDPIVCPKCQTEFDPEAFLKTRRTRTAVTPDKTEDTTPDTEAEETESLDEEESADNENGDEDEDMIEDASELGEDEDDMVEVIENVDEESEER